MAESQDAEKAVDVLSENLSELGIHMRSFSLSMRSLYVENSVSSSVEHGSEFIKLRDATKNDATLYLKKIMPINEEVVQKVQQFIEFYDALSFEEWQEMVDDILEEVTACKEKCSILVKLHEGMVIVLKKRQDDAKVLCTKFNDLQKEYEEKVAELRVNADWKIKYAVGLCLIPVVGQAAAIMLTSSARNNIADATAEDGQQKIMVAAANALTNVLIPAVENFIRGLEIIGGFFNIMQAELKSFDAVKEKKKLHYIRLKKKSAEIKLGCRAFYGVLPAVRTDFQAIPTEGTDLNYVDQWLEDQRKVIEANRREVMSRLSRRFMLRIRGNFMDDSDLESD